MESKYIKFKDFECMIDIICEYSQEEGLLEFITTLFAYYLKRYGIETVAELKDNLDLIIDSLLLVKKGGGAIACEK